MVALHPQYDFAEVSGCQVLDFPIVDCPEASLGALKSPGGLPGEKKRSRLFPDEEATSEVAPGAAVVNGVALPELVLEQLKKIGIPVSWYSKEQLEEAVRDCAVDCTLLDDPDDNGLTSEYDALGFNGHDEAVSEEKAKKAAATTPCDDDHESFASRVKRSRCNPGGHAENL